MDKLRLHKRLTSCHVTRKLLDQMENYLQVQIPRLFQKELANMSGIFNTSGQQSLKRYSLFVVDGGRADELKSAAELKGAVFPRKIQRLTLTLRLGIPEILSLTLIFPTQGTPTIDLSLADPKGKPKAQQIAAGIQELLLSSRSAARVFHSRVFQVGLALALPLALAAYAWWRQLDLVSVVFALGWLVLLSVFVIASLKRVFPYLTFQTDRRFSVMGVAHLFGLVLLNGLVAGYVYLLLRTLTGQELMP